MGPPGAGKGTQAKLIAKTFGVPHLSTGDMFRDAISRGTEIGRLAEPIMEHGGLVPDDIVMKMVEERLRQPDSSGGVVLDGFPRTLPQAEKFDRVLDRLGFGKPIVVDIQVEPEKLVHRPSSLISSSSRMSTISRNQNAWRKWKTNPVLPSRMPSRKTYRYRKYSVGRTSSGIR